MNAIRDIKDAARACALAHAAVESSPDQVQPTDAIERLDRIERLLNAQHRLIILMVERLGLVEPYEDVRCTDDQEPQF